jgi:site-specific recombinase XerD
MSPAEDLLPPEREVRPPRVLSEAEYERLRHAARGNTRDAAIIELALQTGIRISEISRLTLTDVIVPIQGDDSPLPTGQLRVAGRGKRARTVTLNSAACAALRSCLAER